MLPALEDLQTAWEQKRDSPRFELYKDAIEDGLGKLQKYYSCMDYKPSFVLALGLFQHCFYPPINILFETALHPYYKLDYFQLKWGGAEEQEEELRNGNLNAKKLARRGLKGVRIYCKYLCPFHILAFKI